VSGLGTPDDLVEFREQQKGFQARLERWMSMLVYIESFMGKFTASNDGLNA
jgi:hypothetical protein